MRVLLCSTYELGHQPLTLAQPAAHLEAAGFDVTCRDLAVQRLERDIVERADVVGISIPMHTAIRLGVRLGQQIKALRPDVHLCYYGLYASLNADYLLERAADSVIGGEVEGPLVALVGRLAGQVGTPVAGVRSRDGEHAAPFLGRQRFLVPARRLLPPLDRYSVLEWGRERRTTGYLETSRGCAHTCLHCPVPAVYEGRVRIVQEDALLEDIAQLVDMGARHIDFGDPDFLNGVRHSLRVVRRMHERFPELTFNLTTKIEHVVQHRDAVAELSQLGCAFVTSAVESFSDHVLARLEKGHTEADVRAASAIAGELGLVIRPTFVAFTPWTRADDYARILETVEELGWIDHVAPVQYAIRLLLPPGSLLLGRPSTDEHLDGFDEDLFTYRWRHPDPEMDRLCDTATALVREADAAGEDPRLTFYRLKSLALAAAGGRRVPVEVARTLPEQRAAPRLSEPWFC